MYIYLIYLMAGLYLLAGINHFVNPKLYLKITPPWLPYPATANKIVGFVEILLGLGLCLEVTRSWSAWGIIALLIVVFPANVYHFQKVKAKGRGVLLTLLRLPMQALLIYWAYLYT